MIEYLMETSLMASVQSRQVFPLARHLPQPYSVRYGYGMPVNTRCNLTKQ